MLERLLVGEPPSLDLVNMERVDHGRSVDFLDDPDAADPWFRGVRLHPDQEDLDAPRSARAAIRRCLDAPDPAADDDLNAVLVLGYDRTSMTITSV